jgi:hypothetical protein
VTYNPTHEWVITWGSKLIMTPRFRRTYSDEAYAVLSQEWIEKNGQAVSGFNLAQLQADLASL